jgi:hypothetical protein
MKRNYLVLVCLLVAVICFIGCKRQIKQGNFVYEYDPMGATSVVKYTGSDAVVEIPAKYKDSPIMYINTGAFQDLPNLQKVRLNTEEKVMIFDRAFVNCPKLNDVSAKGAISFNLNSSFKDVFVNCPVMPIIATASSGRRSSDAIKASRNALAMFLHDPKTAEFSNEKIVAQRTVYSQSAGVNFEYYIVQVYVRAKNAYGAYTTQWFLVEVAIDDNNKQYFKNDNSGVQSFDFQPTQLDIDVMKGYMGW